MKIALFSMVMLAGSIAAHPAQAQQNAREQLRLYVRQAGPVGPGERNWRDFGKYDFDRPEPGQRAYYANRYYRDWRYYEARTLDRSDRIYRGRDRRYYCRRADGTTGRIAGQVGAIENGLALGASSPIYALLGGKDGAKLGAQVDQGKITCH